MKEYFQKFKELLEERLEKIYTTEDSIRYLFFSTLILGSEYKVNDMIIEYPHTSIEKAKIDTYIIPKNKNGWAIEFKYDRRIPSNKNSPKPQKAGKLFNDLYRLINFKTNNKDRYLFIYVTDDEMGEYLSKIDNKLSTFFNLKKNEEMLIDKNFIMDKSETFIKQIEGELKCKIICLLSENININHFLRIYEVIPC